MAMFGHNMLSNPYCEEVSAVIESLRQSLALADSVGERRPAIDVARSKVKRIQSRAKREINDRVTQRSSWYHMRGDRIVQGQLAILLIDEMTTKALAAIDKMASEPTDSVANPADRDKPAE